MAMLAHGQPDQTTRPPAGAASRSGWALVAVGWTGVLLAYAAFVGTASGQALDERAMRWAASAGVALRAESEALLGQVPALVVITAVVVGLMGMATGRVARTAVVAGTATAVSNRVSRRQAGRWAAQEEQQVQQQAPPQQYAAPPQQQYAPPPPDAPDPDADLARLQQLGELRASGVLTEQEFQTQKSRILGL